MSSENGYISSPFDRYDVFGYIMPASCFLGGSSIIAARSPFLDQKLRDIMKDIPCVPRNTAFAVMWIIGAFFILYVCGHVVSLISSLFIDKCLVQHCAGYPYEKLIHRAKLSPRQRMARNFHRISYSLLLMFSIVLGTTEFSVG